ncbi:hypothetical protein HMPREF9244_01209 [Alloscardovia omnicolens F0580]|uniref:Uncharacterized protein n=1 Tax=Alloscardovia omnicolens F0580 TaxID=1321816 RepID=U1SDV9_9BIFI|nr:hypothetical protein HMPREF9244_01209 [Alloscardovia omnicolens F0580]
MRYMRCMQYVRTVRYAPAVYAVHTCGTYMAARLVPHVQCECPLHVVRAVRAPSFCLTCVSLSVQCY